MLKVLNTFRKEESGAVTIDWVILTAAIVGLAIGAWTAIDDNTLALRDSAAADVASQNN